MELTLKRCSFHLKKQDLSVLRPTPLLEARSLRPIAKFKWCLIQEEPFHSAPLTSRRNCGSPLFCYTKKYHPPNLARFFCVKLSLTRVTAVVELRPNQHAPSKSSQNIHRDGSPKLDSCTHPISSNRLVAFYLVPKAPHYHLSGEGLC